MNLATLAALTLAALTTSACTIVITGPDADDESTSTTVAASSFPEIASTGEPEDSSTGREIASTSEAEPDDGTSTGEEASTTTEADGSSSTGGSTGTSDDTTTGGSSEGSSSSGEPDIEPTIELNDLCASDGECFSGMCREGVCTVACEQFGVPCAHQGALGLCVRPVDESYCAGLHDFGGDLPDYALIAPGGEAGLLIADGLDIDLATLDLTNGSIASLKLVPAPELDVKVAFYDSITGQLWGTINNATAGETEFVDLGAMDGLIVYAIVSGIGGTTGSVVFSVD
jgi:hypothetical protein